MRSSLNDNPGTIVKEETESMEDVVIRGISLDKNQAKVTLVAVPDNPGVAARIFKALADGAINVDMIVQNVSHGSGAPATDLSFTVDKPDLLKASKVIDSLKADIGYRETISDESSASGWRSRQSPVTAGSRAGGSGQRAWRQARRAPRALAGY